MSATTFFCAGDTRSGGVIMNVTIKEVARLAGVSPSTVSRTCSDHPSISAQTKERVRRAMQELGYEPGNSGPSMPGSKTIGIVLPVSEDDTFENAFFLETMRGISLFCNQKQYFTTLITGSSNEELLSAIRAMVRENHLDGIILLYSNAQDPVIDYLYENGILFVQIGKASQYPGETICIDNDNILPQEKPSAICSLWGTGGSAMWERISADFFCRPKGRIYAGAG